MTKFTFKITFKNGMQLMDVYADGQNKAILKCITQAVKDAKKTFNIILDIETI